MLGHFKDCQVDLWVTLEHHCLSQKVNSDFITSWGLVISAFCHFPIWDFFFLRREERLMCCLILLVFRGWKSCRLLLYIVGVSDTLMWQNYCILCYSCFLCHCFLSEVQSPRPLHHPRGFSSFLVSISVTLMLISDSLNLFFFLVEPNMSGW